MERMVVARKAKSVLEEVQLTGPESLPQLWHSPIIESF